MDAGQPFVIPTAFARIGDEVVIHGSAASRMLKLFCAGAPGCLTVTLLDGLVLARSAFHHSMNYRSVVVLGTPREIADPAEKARALDAIVEHIVPGRLASVRGASEQELRGTRVVAFALDEASAKLRTGPPKDDEEDYALAGVGGRAAAAALAARAGRRPAPRARHPAARARRILAARREAGLACSRAARSRLLAAVQPARPFADERLLLDRRLETLRRILPDGPTAAADVLLVRDLAEAAHLARVEIEPRAPARVGDARRAACST